MDFEWDEAKDAANIAKHGVSFTQAKLIFAGVVVSRLAADTTTAKCE
ncbi:MAG: Ribonuclease toxin, BrnT, of type toxin-antitoxin system [Caulobacteraceae bacterium]|nr:Ribonuclease toxin, BrnT, of type toxin-antitoxin system [Caulobacteraceae bacterium]